MQGLLIVLPTLLQWVFLAKVVQYALNNLAVSLLYVPLFGLLLLLMPHLRDFLIEAANHHFTLNNRDLGLTHGLVVVIIEDAPVIYIDGFLVVHRFVPQALVYSSWWSCQESLDGVSFLLGGKLVLVVIRLVNIFGPLPEALLIPLSKLLFQVCDHLLVKLRSFSFLNFVLK